MRWPQLALYAAAIVTGVLLVLLADGWIDVRQLFGLWALALLLTSMLIGPLTSLLPRLPLAKHLIAARRAIGVSAFAFAVVHVGCYLLPVIIRNWREILAPGLVWIGGLLVGSLALVMLVPLAWTSRDSSIAALGGQRWLRLHRFVYAILPIVLLHAMLVGSDFGAGRAPDVKGQPDVGSLYMFLGLSCAWAILILLSARRRGRRTAA